MTNVVMIGLGAMGRGMAESCLRAGLSVRGVDISAEAEAAIQALGGSSAPTPDAVAAADVAVLVVVNADQMETVLFDAPLAVAEALPKGAVVMACVTIAPERAREFEARLAERGILYLDAPISGGSTKSAQGQLTIMASGTMAAFERAQPALDAMAETVFRLGDAAGPASAMKIVNQLLAGVHIAAAAEAMAFGLAQGVQPRQCLDVISKCAGSSWMFENRGAHIADGDYTPRSAVEIFVKDLGIVSDIARSSRFAAPLASTALQQFLAASGMGLGREDDAAVVKVYAAQGGLDLPGGAST